MKTIRELKVKDWNGYFFEEMINILDIDPERFMLSDNKQCKDGKMLHNLCYSDKTGVSHIVVNNIDRYLKKIGTFSYLVFLCQRQKQTHDI